ncbi:HAMP domain-containing protein [bacterium]|nr:HAMP domain-containing protein [bacterium]
MKSRQKLSISVKIIALTLSLLLVSILVPAILVYVNTQKAVLDATQKELEQTSLLTQKALISWIGFLKMDIQTMGSLNTVLSSTKTSFIGKASRKGAEKQLLKKIEEFKFYESLSIADKDGTVVVTTNSKLLDTNISKQAFYSPTLQGKTSVSTLSLNDVSGAVNFIISSPIDENDTPVGLVFGQIDLGYFEADFIKPIKIGNSGFISLIDQTGRYISFPDQSKLLKENAANDGFIKRILESSEGVLSYQTEGQGKISTFKQVPETGWRVVVTAVSSELLAPLNRLTMINSIVALVMIVLAVLVSIWAARKIKNPLVKAVAMINAMSKGDFDKRIDVQTRDETEDLANSMNELANDLKTAVTAINGVMGMVARGDLSKTIDENLQGDLQTLQLSINESINLLSETIFHVVTTSSQVKTGTDEILSAAENLANGNSQQAASLEQITSTMNEIEGQTAKNDENAIKARDLANRALETVRDGNSRMNHMQKSMEKINETSANVSKVIKVIDEIAFQTNLLALNAAVEAARAGKYGKGFAVVAEEVRNLAGRSAKAAKNTSELIETSIKEVENGVKSSDQTAEVLAEITNGVEKITDLVAEIAVASTEQKMGISEVNKGLALVNNVVQQNSSIAEETSSSSQELSASAHRLEDLVRNFTLKQTSASSSQPEKVKAAQGYRPKAPEALESKPKVPRLTQKTNSNSKSTHQIVLDDDDFGKY